MKAITIYQPWASLIACGAKRFETRSWATSYRGPIAIHAGLKYINCFMEGFAERAHKELKERIQDFTYMHDLPRGFIIAIGKLAECHLIQDDGYAQENQKAELTKYIQRPNYFREYIQGKELIFGDFTPGRYAWEFADVVMLPEPIPAVGHQRLWEWAA